MNEKIQKTLNVLEKSHSVKIVWAIESGSRAWGFASEDSDYDVRCMHIKKLDDYLGLFPPPQQINLSYENLDIESWDIQKFARLSIKSNPQIAEWLRSPVIYKDSPIRKQWKNYFDAGCSLGFLRQHYLRMAKQNYRKYMGIGMAHSCKKYLYILRGIACAVYIEKEKKLPPLPYQEVIPYLPLNVQQFFEKCVIQKNTTERAQIIVEEEVIRFIDSALSLKFDKKERGFSKTKELSDYVIKTIKRQVS